MSLHVISSQRQLFSVVEKYCTDSMVSILCCYASARGTVSKRGSSRSGRNSKEAIILHLQWCSRRRLRVGRHCIKGQDTVIFGAAASSPPACSNCHSCFPRTEQTVTRTRVGLGLHDSGQLHPFPFAVTYWGSLLNSGPVLLVLAKGKCAHAVGVFTSDSRVHLEHCGRAANLSGNKCSGEAKPTSATRAPSHQGNSTMWGKPS